MRTGLSQVVFLAELLALSACLRAAGERTGASSGGGEPLPSGCLAVEPLAVDFGYVLDGTKASREVKVTNRCGVAVDVTVGMLEGTSAALFSTSPATLELGDGQTSPVTVEYHPLTPAPPANPMGAPVPEWGFGAARPNQSVTRCASVSNVANASVSFPALVVLNVTPDGMTAAGAFQPAPGFPSSPSTIAPDQSLDLCVVFTPPSWGVYQGEVAAIDEAQTAQASFAVSVCGSGAGGGCKSAVSLRATALSGEIPLQAQAKTPQTLYCSPLSLDFGENAIVGGVPIAATLRILCTNIGDNFPGHPEANLFIPDPNSSDPGLSIRNGDPAFQAAFEQPFPAAGLASGESAVIDVIYSPTVAGRDMDELIISSNDWMNSKMSIPLLGSAQALPGCHFSVVPSTGLDFGHVDVGNEAEIPFQVVTDSECTVTDLHVVTGSPPLSLPDYPAGLPNRTVIPSGGSLAVAVACAPTPALRTCAGTIGFTVSATNEPSWNNVITLTSQ